MVYDVKERHEPTVILGDIWLKNSDPSLKHFTINCQEIYLKLKKCFNYKKTPYTVEHGKSEHG